MLNFIAKSSHERQSVNETAHFTSYVTLQQLYSHYHVGHRAISMHSRRPRIDSGGSGESDTEDQFLVLNSCSLDGVMRFCGYIKFHFQVADIGSELLLK